MKITHSPDLNLFLFPFRSTDVNSAGRKRPAESEAENNSQYIDVNQMKRTKLASNVKNVDTLCSLIFSEEED